MTYEEKDRNWCAIGIGLGAGFIFEIFYSMLTKGVGTMFTAAIFLSGTLFFVKFLMQVFMFFFLGQKDAFDENRVVF